jgi:hypothetical protein
MHLDHIGYSVLRLDQVQILVLRDQHAIRGISLSDTCSDGVVRNSIASLNIAHLQDHVRISAAEIGTAIERVESRCWNDHLIVGDILELVGKLLEAHTLHKVTGADMLGPDYNVGIKNIGTFWVVVNVLGCC